MFEEAVWPPRIAASFAPQQLELIAALEERDSRFAQWYTGALQTLGNVDNPERFSQAAHSMRELMEKLPEHAYILASGDRSGRVSLRGQGNLRTEAQGLRTGWMKGKQATKCHDGAGWSGPIDSVLVAMLERVEAFISWVEENRPSRATIVGTGIESLDGSGRSWTLEIRAENVKRWTVAYEYFESVCHHGRAADPEAFNRYLTSVEHFLLDLLAPRAMEDLADIESIIREGER
jgi:hypothetical protein